MKKRRSASKRPLKKTSTRRAGPLIGRQRFEKISAVEGIVLSKPMVARVADFERRGMSPEERRAVIIHTHRKG